MLELQFENILTKTSLAEGSDGASRLSIAAFLPRSDHPDYATRPPEDASSFETKTFLWDADEGRHVMLRYVPLDAVQDERHLMDAILETFDEAKAWLSGDEDEQAET